MIEIDPFVAALISLCVREGGHKSVADKAKVSPDNLWQIINGIKLPSGNPRGVGPELRKKLNSAYPGWNEPIQGPSSTRIQATVSQDISGTVNETASPALSADALEIARWFDGLTTEKDRFEVKQIVDAEILGRRAGRAAALVAQIVGQRVGQPVAPTTRKPKPAPTPRKSSSQSR